MMMRCFAGLLLFLAFFSPLLAQLTVHEWGTFTTLHASSGQRLSGLYLEEEKLPSFVYQHSLPGNINDRLIANKGIFAEPVNVTVKMETPVLYFYAAEPATANVRVDFPGGSISQWYPQRTAGDTLPPADAGKIDFSKKLNGWIEWNNIQILAPNTKTALSPNPAQETATWTSPRATRANSVQVNGETEKFLFYRGLGNFSIPIAPVFLDNERLEIRNNGQDTIPFVWVYEQPMLGPSRVWAAGKIAPNAVLEVSEKNAKSANFEKFEQALVQAGLFPDEAQAMLQTWEKSYFQQPGLRVFWIVPKPVIDSLLPIQVAPAPAQLARVFVGRCDMLRPILEQQLVKDYQENGLYNWKKHRYYLGFLERAKELSKK